MGEESFRWPSKRKEVMKRLIVNVEGHTEEQFVNNVLSEYLYRKGFSNVSARLIGNARQRNRRGGIRGWPTVKSELVRQLQGDSRLYTTTMVDYYALPSGGESGWPGRDVLPSVPFLDKAKSVEDAVHVDLQTTHGNFLDCRRFVPFVMMYEYEGLLFSDCEKMAEAFCLPHLHDNFKNIRDQFDCPEQINDSPTTAPSKRIIDLVPGYEKPLYGVVAALDVGIDAIIAECPHFADWIKTLESL